MTYCDKIPDYYDANYVANMSDNSVWHDEPTLCDCGAETRFGDVYCDICKDEINIAMKKAIGHILRFCNFTRDEAEQAITYYMENPEKFEEDIDVKTI